MVFDLNDKQLIIFVHLNVIHKVGQCCAIVLMGTFIYIINQIIIESSIEIVILAFTRNDVSVSVFVFVLRLQSISISCIDSNLQRVQFLKKMLCS